MVHFLICFKGLISNIVYIEIGHCLCLLQKDMLIIPLIEEGSWLKELIVIRSKIMMSALRLNYNSNLIPLFADLLHKARPSFFQKIYNDVIISLFRP